MLQDPESVYDILSPFLLRCCRGNVYKLDPFSGIWNRAASSVQRPRCTLPKDIAPNFIVYEASVVAKADLKRARKVVSTSQNVGINQGKEKRPLYNKNTKIYVDKQEGLATNDGEQQSLVLTERDNRDSYPDEKQDRWITYKCSFSEEKSRNKITVRNYTTICREKHPLVELSHLLIFQDRKYYGEGAAEYFKPLIHNWCQIEKRRSCN
ncbi:unnamed protein product [Bursaphelenchus okinawaensis]|uniref:Uncharacterized protein n=1 Tax=Bursaphelenchus okinawaensis TaxID=465554 RepID=A0A811KX01_9BILA|nr:unnamed protein product [Bursaphelenchus okinawaensis]CAG9114762.1 unnamed protein product [Bursaphelenchus okinawaensis]